MKNRKRVLQSSDEEESGKEIATDGGRFSKRFFHSRYVLSSPEKMK